MFTLPDPLPADKDLSPVSLKIYKGRLNSLSRENDLWSTVAGLKKHSKKICEHIDNLADNSEKGRLKKRGILQAIFSVLDETYRNKKNTYYKFWQKSAMPITAVDGSDWQARSKYTPNDS
jgi:hypothetical protein